MSSDLGQHLLRDPRAIERVVDAAGLRAGENVLDAGAGTGALTLPVAATVGPKGDVYAVEIDPAMVAALRAAAPSHVTVIEGDLLHVPLPVGLDAVVANPPFKVAAPFIERLAAARIPRSILVLPRELIDRLAAPPGSVRYGRLTIRVALRAHVEDLGALSRHAFDPPPAVPCGFMRMRPRADAPTIDAAVLDQVLDTARDHWDRRATQTVDALARHRRVDSARLMQVLKTGGWVDLRTSALPPEAFGALAHSLKE